MQAKLLLLLGAVALLALYGLRDFSTRTDENYQLHFVDSDTAKCLDGSKPSFYFYPGSGEGASKFLVYFEGGAWLLGKSLEETLDYGYNRSFTALGTSSVLNSTRSWKQGIFSRNPEVNPHFYNWNSVHINYCDGTGHQGFKTESIRVKDRDLWFRGEANTKAIISTLNELFNFNNAKEVLLSGCSAGGLAVFNWANYFRGIFDPSVKVMAAPDSGLFLDMIPINGDLSLAYRNIGVKNFMEIVNIEVDPINSKCVAANPDEKWKCIMSPYLIDYIDVPLFFVQSLYDQASIPFILQTNCVEDGTLNKCTQEQKDYIEVHHNNVYHMIKDAIAKNPSWGAWSPSCINHCYEEWVVFNSDNFNVPLKSHWTISEGLGQWVESQSANPSHAHIDEVKWPLNSACINRVG